MAKKKPKARLIFRNAKNSRFAKKEKARVVIASGRVFRIPRNARKKERERIYERARKYLGRETFAQKVARQIKEGTPSGPRMFRFYSVDKTLNVPGSTTKTFKITKYIFELNPPYLFVNRANLKKKIRGLKNNAYPRFFENFEAGKNYLFRIDTAYSDEKGFARVDAYLKAGKDGLSDGRGFSIGRYLKIESKKKLLTYLNETFEEFMKGFETYIARKGIVSGQINALTLEIS